jgi:hypothetical protein
MNNILSRLTMAGAAALLAATAGAQSTKVVFLEDFETITLGPNVEEGIATGAGGQQQAVWTDAWPADWSDTFSLPGVGVLEWQGWSIADGAWWQFTCGDQDRSNFTTDAGHLSYGAALIADPDEWDDYDANGLNPDGQGTFDASVTTAAFSFIGATPGTAVIRYFSSWRDEGNQTAVVSISYDGGAFTPIKTYSSDPVSPDFVNDSPNEIVEIPLNNPGGVQNARLRFELNNAVNNWWFAVDSIVVFAETTAPNTYPPAPFFLDAPVFNLTTAVPFTWGEVEGATSYTIQLSKTADFAKVSNAFNFVAHDQALPIGQTQPGVYYARVIAHNDFGSRNSENTVRLVVDRECLADYNEDGLLDFFDLQVFLNLFSAPCP